jgi:hypothetical protein
MRGLTTPSCYLLSTECVDDDDPTRPLERTVFFGIAYRVAPYPADKPLPIPGVAPAIAQATVLEKRYA